MGRPPAELHGKLLDFIKAHPGCGSEDVCQHLGIERLSGHPATYQLRKLKASGAIEVRGAGASTIYFVRGTGDEYIRPLGGEKKQPARITGEQRNAMFLKFLQWWDDNPGCKMQDARDAMGMSGGQTKDFRERALKGKWLKKRGQTTKTTYYRTNKELPT